MRVFKVLLLILGLLSTLFLFPYSRATAGSQELLLKLLIKKGIITQQEVSKIMNEIEKEKKAKKEIVEVTKKEVIKEIKEENIKVIFYENFENSSVIKSIAKDLNVKVDTLQPLANITKDEAKKKLTYKDIMIENLKKLKMALECE